jgi:hypothetical protein
MTRKNRVREVLDQKFVQHETGFVICACSSSLLQCVNFLPRLHNILLFSTVTDRTKSDLKFARCNRVGEGKRTKTRQF